jgi:hypothetical protein
MLSWACAHGCSASILERTAGLEASLAQLAAAQRRERALMLEKQRGSDASTAEAAAQRVARCGADARKARGGGGGDGAVADDSVAVGTAPL